MRGFETWREKMRTRGRLMELHHLGRTEHHRLGQSEHHHLGLTEHHLLGQLEHLRLGLTEHHHPGLAAGASSPEVDESTPATSPGVALAAHKLRVTRAFTRANPNTEGICYGALTDYHLLEIRMLIPAKGPPRVNLEVGSLDFAHDDGEPRLASTALMYTTKASPRRSRSVSSSPTSKRTQ